MILESFWRGLATFCTPKSSPRASWDYLGHFLKETLRMCLHSCVPIPFLVKFGDPAPPKIKVTSGVACSGAEEKHTFGNKSEESVWEWCKFSKTASVHAPKG